ncbi:MAG: MurR/RpiR family transcriptional regulator [Solobacterium sp.]|nr:MurR/RpiR family transcriptional regulator [Solobacterium sp.]
MIIDRLTEEKGFTETDKAIARYIRTHDIEHMTSSELGRRAGASQSAVIRLVNKLGMATYRQFQIELQLDKSLRMHLMDQFPVIGAREAEMVALTIFQSTVYDTNQGLSAAVLEEVCARLLKAEVIDCFGAGISSLFTRMFVFHLQGIGLNARYIEVPSEMYMSHLEDRPRMAVIFSLSGENQTMVDAARILREKNIYTAVIAGNEGSELRPLASILLTLSRGIHSDSGKRNYDISCLYVCHIIYNLLEGGILQHK